jgi:hypothetical protein
MSEATMSEAMEWRRSSFCADGTCAEIKIDGDVVLLRSTIRPESTVEFTLAEWAALKAAVVNGEF